MGEYDLSFRIPQHEGGDISYAILHPNTPCDDDSMLLLWDKNIQMWKSVFDMVIGGVPFDYSKAYMREKIENDKPGERAALVLLYHFGLEKKSINSLSNMWVAKALNILKC